MKKLVVLLFLFATVAFSATNVFIYGNKEATNLENNIGYQKHGQKIKTGDTDDPTSVAKSGNINSLYLRNGTVGAYLKQDNGATTNWKMLENYLTFSAPLSRTGDTISFSGIPLSSLTDVDVDPLADNDVLVWDAGASKWTAQSFGMSDLSDTDVSAAANGNILKFNDSTMTWDAADYPTISSLDDTVISTPTIDQYLRFDGTNWVNADFIIPASGAVFALYPDDSASDLGGIYQKLLTYPAGGTEDIDTIVVNSGTSPVELSHRYVMDIELGTTTIPAGVWDFFAHAYVDNATGVTQMRLTVFVYEADTDVVDLFTVTTDEINNTVNMLMEMKSYQPAFTVNATDRLGIKVSALTTSVANRTLSFTHNGTENYSYFTTPLASSHNNLTGLQGGTSGEFYHLSSADYTGTGSGVLVRATAPTIATSVTVPEVIGGTGSGGNLQIRSTSNATKGSVLVDSSIISNTNATDDLGSAAIAWKEGFINKLSLDSNGQTTTIAGSASASASVNYLLPPADGAAGNVLKTNGSGGLSWDLDGGGGGGLDIYAIYEADAQGSTNFTDDLTNATFSLETSTPISGTKSYKIANVTAGSGTVTSPDITLTSRNFDRTNSVAFIYKYDGTNGDFTAIPQVYRSAAWEDVGTALSITNTGRTEKAEIAFFVPSDATKARLKITLAVANNGKTLLFGDLQFSDNPFQYVNLGDNAEGIRFHTHGGYGLTATKIPYFTTASDNQGLAVVSANASYSGKLIQVLNDTTNGLRVIALKDCAVNLGYSFGHVNAGVGGTASFSKNSGSLTTSVTSISDTERIGLSISDEGSVTSSAFLVLKAGDIIRPHTNGQAPSSNPERSSISVVAYQSTLSEHIVTPARAGSHLIYWSQAHTSMTNTAAEIQFAGNPTINTYSGSPLISVVDDGANTRTKFIALKDCNVTVSLSGEINTAANATAIYKNTSTIVSYSGATNTNGYRESTTGLINLSVGDYITVGTTASIEGTAYLSILATPRLAEFTAAVPVPETAVVEYNTDSSRTAVATAGNVVTIPLNEIKVTKPWISIASNQITLAAGTYKIKFDAVHYLSSGTNFTGWTQFYNVSDAAITSTGLILTSASGANSAYSGNETEVTITASKTYELRGYTSSVTGTSYWGNNIAGSPVKAYVSITRIK